VSGTAGELSGRKGRYQSGSFHLRDEHDWYIEPAWCVEALLDVESFPETVWDPACGAGTIPRACFDRGLAAHGSDIVDRGWRYRFKVMNFLTSDPAECMDGSIICNPPYAHAEAFVRHALKCAGCKVAVLVQAKFLFSQRRYKLFKEHPPSRILFLSRRPSMPPGAAYLARWTMRGSAMIERMRGRSRQIG
jgi:hypothetical protein